MWLSRSIIIVLVIIIFPIIALASEILKVGAFGHYRKGFDPLKAYSDPHLATIACLHKRLVKIGQKGWPVSSLAKTWRISGDRLEYQFTLSDTQNVVAADVAYTFQRILASSSNAFNKKLLESLLDKERTLDEQIDSRAKKFTFYLKSRYAPFMHLLTSPELAIVKKGVKGLTGDYRIETIERDKSFRLVRVSSSSYFFNKIHLDVNLNFSDAQRLLDSRKYDVLLGIPPLFSKDLRIPLGYLDQRTHQYFPGQLHLAKNKKALQDRAFRIALRRLVQAAVSDWLVNKENFIHSFNLVPKGLLLPSYYIKERKEVSSNLMNKLREQWKAHLDRYGVKIWLPEFYLDESLRSHIESRIKKISSNVEVVLAPFRKISDKMKSGYFDIIAGEGKTLFRDPDSFLIMWEHNFPPFLPFLGRDLLRNIEKARFIENKRTRLEKYGKIIRSFEDDEWVIPMFNMREPVIYRKDLIMPDPAFSHPETICSVGKKAL
ncbi:MAG: hypothetical protein KDD61_12705 [Bdellovibrionales bacterium]|nr:hypothetical protein [Bdellovibrionales bacterium]